MHAKLVEHRLWCLLVALLTIFVSGKVLLQASGKIKRQGDPLKKRRKKERVGGGGGGEKEGGTATTPSTCTERPDSKLAVEDPPSHTVPDSVITEFFEV